jgi:hypothetical protein
MTGTSPEYSWPPDGPRPSSPTLPAQSPGGRPAGNGWSREGGGSSGGGPPGGRPRGGGAPSSGRGIAAASDDGFELPSPRSRAWSTALARVATAMVAVGLIGGAVYLGWDKPASVREFDTPKFRGDYVVRDMATAPTGDEVPAPPKGIPTPVPQPVPAPATPSCDVEGFTNDRKDMAGDWNQPLQSIEVDHQPCFDRVMFDFGPSEAAGVLAGFEQDELFIQFTADKGVGNPLPPEVPSEASSISYLASGGGHLWRIGVGRDALFRIVRVDNGNMVALDVWNQP